MREVTIPVLVNIDNQDYQIEMQAFQDNVISALAGRTFTADFTERPGGSVTIDNAILWIKSQLVTVDPFVVPNKMYYIGDPDDVNGYMSTLFNALNIVPTSLAETGTQPIKYKLLNGTQFNVHNTSSYIDKDQSQNIRLNSWAGNNTVGGNVTTTLLSYWYLDLTYWFYPLAAISGDSMSDTTTNFTSLRIVLNGNINASLYPDVKACNIYINSVEPSYMKTYSIYGDLIDISYLDLGAEVTGFSGDDPYSINPSTVGGGYGTGIINPSDIIPDPEAPDIDAISTGLLTIFKPTLSQIQQLGDYLWSNAFDVDTLKKLFGDPMDAIIGLSIVPVNPPGAGSKNVKVGNIDTGISMSYVGRQFIEKDLGSLNIDPYIGSFMDYSPYTKISIFLPYIGFRELSPEDVMGTTISIKYIVDVLTGGCNAILNVSGKGAIYQFNGSCIANVPLTALNYSGAIQNAISAIGSIATTGAGIASGNAALAGVGAIGLATRAANAAINTKPTIQRSGNAGGASGLCGTQFAYAIIERPRLSTPAGYNNFIGNTLNVTMNIGDCSGFTMIEEVHLDGVLCTENERDELLKLLKEGVIIHVPEPEPEPTPNT